MDNIQEMRGYALFVDRINREVFRGGLGVNALENHGDISTIVTVQDKAISRHFLEGMGDFEGVQKKYPGSFSEEMDSQDRVKSLEIMQLDPIDGTGDLNKSTHPDYATFRKEYGITKPYGATNLISKLERSSLSEPFRPTAGMIFDFIDNLVLLGDQDHVELCRIDNGDLISINYKLKMKNYKMGGPLRIGKRVAYPHDGFDKFLEFLKDQNMFEVDVVTIGGAGRAALQLLRTNMGTDGPVPEDYKDTGIDVLFNYQPDHKTWDLDPTLAMYKQLGITMPTDVYGRDLTANAANTELNPGAWHKKGYLYSACGAGIHHLMATYASKFEKETGFKVTDAKLNK